MSDQTAGPRHFGIDRQLEIYSSGMLGVTQSAPFRYEDLQEAARQKLSVEAYDYVAGGAGSEATMRANLEAFRRWRIVPHMLRDVSQRDLRVSILGMELPAPVMLAPIGVQSIVFPEGEKASAKAAASLGVPYVVSTAASHTIEEVIGGTPGANAWYQLYWGKNFDIAASMVSRAEKAGYKAIVVTLDTNLLGWRDRDLEHANLPFLRGVGIANYFADPAFRAALSLTPEEDPIGAVRYWASTFSNAALTWDDLAFLRTHTSLPIVLKGIQHKEDAEEAVRRGIDAIIVSNHGGRQIDGAIGSLDALPGICAQVKHRIPVLFDSGVRRGADAFKALALGASAVLLGRPFVWGLAVGGEQGAREVIHNFLAELDLTFALAGYARPSDLDVLALVKDEDLAAGW